jgi:hypothetical protein
MSNELAVVRSGDLFSNYLRAITLDSGNRYFLSEP